MNSEDIRTLLDVRTYFYQACQVILGTEPTAESVEAFNSGLTRDSFNLLALANPEICKDAASALADTAQSWQDDPDSYLEAARRDYTKQFIGPHKLKAAPWECVYITKERMLLQEQTLAVRACYAREGYAAAQAPHVSDDHIAIELDFIAKLSARASDAYSTDACECVRLLKSMRSFIEEHLLTWVPDYSHDLSQAAPGSLYAAASTSCSAILSIDDEILADLITEIAS